MNKKEIDLHILASNKFKVYFDETNQFMGHYELLRNVFIDAFKMGFNHKENQMAAKKAKKKLPVKKK